MVCNGLRNGITPSGCSSVQALSKPSASARATYALKRAGSNSPSETNCGVEIESGAYEGEVGERLGEVAEVLRLGAELLAVQPQVIGVPEHLLEEEPGLLQVAHAREALD